MSGALPIRPRAGGIRLNLHVKPGARRDAVIGMTAGSNGPQLEIAVRAVPDKGEANDAVLRLIASWLGLKRSDVCLASGGKSRYKTLDIDGNPATLARLVADKIDDIG